jgi:hypothetical protein
MLLELMGETVTHEAVDGTMTDVEHVLCHEADASDQSVMDVQTRFINQARYKGDSRTLTVLWPTGAPHDLMDSHLWVRGERYRVYAQPFPVAHSPNGYDVRVTCMRSLFLYDVELLRVSSRTKDEWAVWHYEYERVPAKANLLRLSEDMLHEARQDGLAGVVLFELPSDTWDPEFVRLAYDGDEYAITSADFAGDVVVIAGTREVTDA